MKNKLFLKAFICLNFIPSIFCSVSCSQKDAFEADSWQNVILYAKQGFDALKLHYNKDTFIGLTKTIKLNGLDHRVRVIGENHDTIAEGELKGKKAALTFELIDLVSGVDKKGLCCQLDKNNNCNYPESNLYNVLNSESNVEWFDNYPEKVVSTKYKKSCLTMLKEENDVLFNALEIVTKTFSKGLHDEMSGSTTYSLSSFKTKLFSLSCTELCWVDKEKALDEDKAYEYWLLHNNNNDRILKHLDGTARSTWLRTPNIKNWKSGWYQHRSGILDVNVWDGITNLGGCAFAFCI